MPELAEVETPKTAGFVDRGYNYEKKRKRMEAEEEEIRKLEAEARGETTTNEEQQPEEEAPKEEAIEEKKADTEVKEETLSAEEKSFKKRYGDLRRHMQEKEKEWDEKFKAFEKRLEKESIVPPKSDEDIEEWSKEYPDVAKIIETIASKKAKEFDSNIEKRLQAIAEKEAEAARKRAEAELITKHPDFEEIRADEQFHEWVTTQPKWVQQALYENDSDAHAAARAIDLYKVDMGIMGNKKKKSNNDAAKAVTTKGQNNVAPTKESQGNQWKESDVAQMKAHEYEKNEKSIMEAIQSGNFVYDVTRPQR